MQHFSSLPHTLVHCHLNTILTLAPLESPRSLSARQLGDIQCNIARFKTVGSLAKAQKAVKALAANATYLLPTLSTLTL